MRPETEENSWLRYAKTLMKLDLALLPGRRLTSLQLSRHNPARLHGSSSGKSLINEIVSFVMSSLGAMSFFTSGSNDDLTTDNTHDIFVALQRKAHIVAVLLGFQSEGIVV